MSNKTLRITAFVIGMAIAWWFTLQLRYKTLSLPPFFEILIIVAYAIFAVYVAKRVYSQDELFKKVMPRVLYLGLFGLVGYLLAVNNCFRDIKGCFTCNSSIVDTLADDIGEE